MSHLTILSLQPAVFIPFNFVSRIIYYAKITVQKFTNLAKLHFTFMYGSTNLFAHKVEDSVVIMERKILSKSKLNSIW